MKEIIVCLLVASILPNLQAQKNLKCYNDHIRQGRRDISSMKYDDAIKNFLSALSCDSINQFELAKLVESTLNKRVGQLIDARDSVFQAQKIAQLQRDSAIAARKIAEDQSKRNKALSYSFLAEQVAEKDPAKGLLLAKLGWEQTDTALPRVKLALSNIFNRQFTRRDDVGNRIGFGEPIPSREFYLKQGHYKIYFDEGYTYLFEQICAYAIINKENLHELADLKIAGNMLNISKKFDHFSVMNNGDGWIAHLNQEKVFHLEKNDSTQLDGEIIFSKKGNKFGAFTREGIFIIWDSTGKQIAQKKLKNEQYPNPDSIRFIRNDKAIYFNQFNTNTYQDGRENLISIWDLETNTLKTMIIHGNGHGIQFSTDGTKCVISDKKNQASLYLIGGTLLKKLNNPENDGGYAVFSPDDRLIYLFLDSGQVMLFDSLGKHIRNFKRPVQRNYITSFSRKNKRFITSSGDFESIESPNPRKSCLFEWDGTLVKELTDPDGVVHAEFFPDGVRILGWCNNGTLIIWNKEGDILQRINSHTAKTKGDMLVHAKITPDNKEVLRVFQGGLLQWFELEFPLIEEYAYPNTGGGLFALFNSTDDKIVLNNQYVLNRYNRKTIELKKCKGEKYLTPDLDHMISYRNKENCLCRLDTGNSWSSSYLQEPYSFSKNGKQFVSFSGIEDLIRIWDVDKGLVDTIHIDQGNTRYSNGDAVFLDADSTIFFNLPSGVSFLYNRNTKKKFFYPVENEIIQTVDVLEPQQLVLTNSTKGVLSVWTIDGIKIDTFYHSKNDAFMVKFSKDGENILFWSQTEMFFFNRKTRKLVEAERLFRPTGDYNMIAFSPDGNLFLTAEYAGSTVSVWDFTGKRRYFFNAHTPGMRLSVLFSPDSRSILTYSDDRAVKLWDITYSGKGNNLIAQFDHQGGVNSGMFSSDGKFIMTAGNDNTIRICPVPETIYEWIKQRTYIPLFSEDLIGLGLD